jgi:DNA modification methylase
MLAGSPKGGIVLDPFFGSGTVGMVAIETGRKCVGVELKSDYVDIAKQRLLTVTPTLDLDFAEGNQTAKRHEPYITPSLSP